MQRCKIKSLEEVKRQKDKLTEEIKRDFKIQTVFIAVLIILALTISLKAMKLAIEYEALKKDKEALEDLVEMQSSAIADLEENCKDLFVKLDSLKGE